MRNSPMPKRRDPDDFALADVGVVQVFVCFDCFEASARVESS